MKYLSRKCLVTKYCGGDLLEEFRRFKEGRVSFWRICAANFKSAYTL